MEYWNPHAETMSRDELSILQTSRLRSTVEKVYSRVPYYRAKMQAKGLFPGDIKTVDDLKLLPFVTKQDLRDTYPYGMFAEPLESISRIHASSGTTGKQTVVGYTKRDLDLWSECMARCLVMAGASKLDIVQVCYGYGLFTGGLGAHGGAEMLGAAVIPASTGNTRRQLTMMKDFGSTVLCCTPSYALYLGDSLKEYGLTKADISLKIGIFGAEPWSVNMRKEIEDRLGIEAFDIYGLSEIMGPSVSQDCKCHKGLHVWEDSFIPEIVDTETLEPLPDGEKGELVITTIDKEGFPLIRFRTRDIGSLTHEKCECGRVHARMSKLSGRSDDMLIIRGVNVFPSQIESVLLESGEISPHYQIIVDRVNNLDTMSVEIEVSEHMFQDFVKGMENTENRIRAQIESVLGISCKVRLVEPKSITRSEGKAKRVIDKRVF
ncbi:MAG: phenylacetate--CoA ligase [Clostridiales bacterium]|jgi:phenylacetate-CoA ligase|nr:phenylacetate--CoA ligase [Clostridiales bacterium]MDR2751756.1 phenylacetate--CoA ligase [Clostridiales bacterium]